MWPIQLRLESMSDSMKVSIITAVFNRQDCIQTSLDSVKSQTYPNIEHIAVDGASIDGTLEILQAELGENSLLISEKDNGIYDALNKGIAAASGEIIGLMHSDDFFAHKDIVSRIATAFNDPTVEAVYGDLEYVAANDRQRVVRNWISEEYKPEKLKKGWMPPHPTLFLRRQVFDRLGNYDTNFKIAADYDAILRWFGKGQIRSHYIPEVLVKMRVGGESNASLAKIFRKSHEDYVALKNNGVGGFCTLVHKNISKIKQFR